MKRHWRIAMISVLLVVQAACVSLPTREPVQLFAPETGPLTLADAPGVHWQLVVARPLSDPALDSPRIAVRPRPGELQSYRGARWTAPAPDLLETALIRTFQDSGKIVAVGRAGDALRADYVLQLDLRAFESVLVDGVPQAHIAVYATLLHAGSRQVVAGALFEHSAAARGGDIADVVAAFGASLGAVVPELAGWTLRSGETHAQGMASP